MYRIITGIKNVVEYHVPWLRSVAFDARFNLDTTFKYSEDKQFPAIIPETQQGYEPVCPATLQKIISRLPINFEEFTFVELGSGTRRGCSCGDGPSVQESGGGGILRILA